MESIENLPIMVDPGVFMASIDLKDAFFSVPINEDHQKCLKFFFGKDDYNFVCMPNGYIFTKIGKTLFTHLRKKGNVLFM